MKIENATGSLNSMKSHARDSTRAKMSRMGIHANATNAYKHDVEQLPVERAAKKKKTVAVPMEGSSGRKRLDKFARGGRIKEAKTSVNIMVAPQGGAPSVGAMPAPGGAALIPPAAAMSMRPPIGGPPPIMPGGPDAAPGMAPGLPMRKRGGRVMDAGAGSGEGREEKSELVRKRK